MTVGSDGALWFTSLTGIYRVTTSGTVTEYTGADSSDPGAIISTPAGSLWFTDPFFNAIGTFNPAS